MEHIKSYVDS